MDICAHVCGKSWSVREGHLMKNLSLRLSHWVFSPDQGGKQRQVGAVVVEVLGIELTDCLVEVRTGIFQQPLAMQRRKGEDEK